MLQEYRNCLNEPVEVKYVFPLDEMAVVCDFEAFINDKHVVGGFTMTDTIERFAVREYLTVLPCR